MYVQTGKVKIHNYTQMFYEIHPRQDFRGRILTQERCMGAQKEMQGEEMRYESIHMRAGFYTAVIIPCVI